MDEHLKNVIPHRFAARIYEDSLSHNLHDDSDQSRDMLRGFTAGWIAGYFSAEKDFALARLVLVGSVLFCAACVALSAVRLWAWL